MAKNLEKAGFPLTVFNRYKAKNEVFIEVSTVADSVEELVAKSDIIFTMISNDTAVGEVYNQVDVLGDIEGKLFIDMRTVSQKLSVSVSVMLKAKGAGFIDAPVAGSTGPAASGTLIILAGGALQDIQKAEPYFNKLGRMVKHLGGNGKGIAGKLCVNYFVSILYQGLAESVTLVVKQGLKRADILEIINESVAGSGATKAKTPLILEDNYPAAFALELMLKDILLARDNGAAFPLTDTLIETYQSAVENGYGKDDVMGIIRNIQ